jgi:hypothetical protein
LLDRRQSSLDKKVGLGNRSLSNIEEHMKITTKALLAAAGIAAFAFSPANAYEGAPFSTQPGVFIGASAGVPPPGIYMFNQIFTNQLNLSGPGTQNTIPLSGGLKIGNNNSQHVNDYTAGFLFVPGWTFLGATYDAVVVQPFVDVGIGNPLGGATIAGNPISPISVSSGVFNTYIVPVELSWKLGNSGFAIKTGFGVFVPDGTHTGVNGLGNVGNPWATFQPELIISYLAGGYNLTAALYEEINTANPNDNYTNGNVFHADFTATKTFGKWTLGPVAHLVAQVTDDSCPVGVCTAHHPAILPPFAPVPITLGGTLANTQRFSVFSVGGLVEYNFGPASLSVWATQDVSAKASNSAAAALGADNSLIGRGFTVFSTLSYRLWAPEEPAKPAIYRK